MASLDVEAAARGLLLKLGPSKRFLIRCAEAVLYPLVRTERMMQCLQRAQADRSVQTILVLEYWDGLGDIVLLLPFLRDLRRYYPNARITAIVNRTVLPLLEGQHVADELVLVRVPWVEHFSYWKKYNPFSFLWINLGRTMLVLRRRRFDLALSGRMDIRDNFLLWVVGAKRRVGYGVGGGGFFLTDVVEPDLRHTHRSRGWLRLLEYLGEEIFDAQPRITISPQEQEWAGRFLQERGIQKDDFLVGIHPGARRPIRQWGNENFATVAARLGSNFPVKILWFLDPNRSSIPDAIPSLCVPVSLDLRRFIGVLARCRLFICNDSGPMHIATALGVPVVAVFGPNQPAWFGPVGDQHRVVYRPEFWCRPCFDRCIFDQPYCLRTIPTSDVLDAAIAMINDRLPRAALPATPGPRQ